MTGDSRPAATVGPQRPAAIRIPLVLALLAGAFATQSVQGMLFSALPPANLPLLTVALMAARVSSSVRGAVLGAVAGCAYDGLTRSPIGLYGMAWTVLGFCMALVGRHLQIQRPGIMALTCATVFLCHEGLVSLLQWTLLGVAASASPWLALPSALLHAGLGMLLWRMLDMVAPHAVRVPGTARGARGADRAVPAPERLRVRGAALRVLGHPDRR